MATINLGSVVPDVAVGTVTTLQPEERATVTVTGSGKKAIFDFGIPQGLGADAQFWTGTVEEYENEMDTIEEGTIVNLTDDTLEDSSLIGTETLNRVVTLETEMDELDEKTTKKSDMLTTMEQVSANTNEEKYVSAIAVKELNSNLSGLWNYEIYNATDISVEISNTWTEVTSYVPTTGNGRYLVIVQIAVPALSEDAMVTVSSNGSIQYSNATAILANKATMRLQSVGFLSVNDNVPIKVNAFSSLPFTCTDARIVCMKIK